jgi:zinc transport system ATP-binding protein
MTIPAVQVTNVDFAYNGAEKILAHVNLTIEPGEFVGVIGPNGGGKTTLLKLLMGFLTPQAGEIRILGNEPQKNRRIIGYVPQFNLFDRDFPITVRKAVLMGRLQGNNIFKRFSKEDMRIVVESLAKMEVDNLLDKPLKELSGGQLQRVMIARALACSPKILLLDEPTANVDIHAEKGLFELLQNLKGQVTVLVVSHDIGFISKYVERVACVNCQLFVHDTMDLTPDALAKVYHIPVKAIHH